MSEILGSVPCSRLFFDAPGCLSIRQETLPPPSPGQVQVTTHYSAISPGTEMLLYRGEFPTDLAVDENIATLGGAFCYPLPYGYAAVGQVSAAGDASLEEWLGRWVFAFQPHQSAFNTSPAELLPLPDDLPPQAAVFLPNMETAVNLVMDGAPLLGERVLVIGQGIVGLLTTALLARFPLACLATLEPYPLRRQASLSCGAHASLDPATDRLPEQLLTCHPEGADLVFELSGVPAALDTAIELTGFGGRVVIGSWYGQKCAPLHLGGRFHRSRIRLLSSQVSTLAPELTGRWTKERRFEVAWEMLRQVRPERWITHQMPLESAAQAYELLDQHPDRAIQVVFTYVR